MSDLNQTFVVNVGGAAGTFPVAVPFNADLVAVTARLAAAGSTASTVDVQVNGTTVFGANTVLTGGDAGASITSNKIQVAGDSASVKAGTATQKTSVNASAAGADQNFVTSGVNIITPVAPADAALKSVSAGDLVSVITTTGTGVGSSAVTLVFVKK